MKLGERKRQLRQIKREVLIVETVILAFLFLAGCRQNGNESENVRTYFPVYSESFLSGEALLDFNFYTTSADREQWERASEAEMYLQIGDTVMPAKVLTVTVDDMPIYSGYDYYYGYLLVEVDLQEAVGEASLSIFFDGKGEETKYIVGNMSVMYAGNTEAVAVTQMTAGGLAREDENGQIFNYGIFIHCEAEEDITITDIGFGLENIGLDAAGCVVYSAETYQSEIYDAVAGNTYDTYVETAYDKHYVETVNSSADIKLEAGEYYLYLPITVTDDMVPSMMQGVICFSYLTKNGEIGSYRWGSFPFFGEMSKSLDELEKILG